MADRPEKSDADLMREAKVRPRVFGEIFERHAPTIYQWLKRRAPELASDPTAETFSQAWFTRRGFHPESEGSAFPWPLGIARNLLRQSMRKKRV